jgi:hypothetical protein
MRDLLSDSVLETPGPWEDQLTPEIAPGPDPGQVPQRPVSFQAQAPVVDPQQAPATPDWVMQGLRARPADAETSSYEGGGIFPTNVMGPPEEAPSDPEDLLPTMAPLSPQMSQQAVIPPLSPAVPLVPFVSPAGGPLQQAVGEIPQQYAHLLGLSVIGTACGATMGFRYGGGYGAIAGGVLAGSAVNVYRAFRHLREGTPEGRKEAMVSGTYAIGAAVLGSLIWWKLAMKGQNSSGRAYSSNRCRSNPIGCGIRPAGP